MQFNDFLSFVAQALLIIALPIVIAAAVQTFRVQTQRLRDNMGEERFNALKSIVQTAVHLAEQSGIVEQLTGPEKREKAIQFVESFLAQRGIKIDVDQIADLIESEVHAQIAKPTPPEDTAEARQALIDRAIESAVLAAEQSGLSGIIQNVGAEKKAYAMQFVRDYLAQHGIQVPDALASGLIEAQLLRFTLAARGQLPPQFMPSVSQPTLVPQPRPGMPPQVMAAQPPRIAAQPPPARPSTPPQTPPVEPRG